jgi:endonuclease/exonuclease/phosphatase family metal-dependent hydrolase
MIHKKYLIILLIVIFLITSTLADSKPKEIRVATWNLLWFFDHDTSDNKRDLAKDKSAPSETAYKWKLNAVADAIDEMDPTILALQEIENEKVVKDLASRLKSKHNKEYTVVFIQGKDYSTEQDVAILAKSGFQSSRRIKLPNSLKKKKNRYKVPTKHLVAEFAWGEDDQEERLIVIVVHFTASGGVQQRMRQGRVVRWEVERFIDDEENVIVLGDFNTQKKFGSSTTKKTGVGIVRGLHTSDSEDDLIDLHGKLSSSERATHRNGDHLDRILISSSLNTDYDYEDLLFDSFERPKKLAIQGKVDKEPSSKYWEIPQKRRDLSDHFPLVATFSFIE